MNDLGIMKVTQPGSNLLHDTPNFCLRDSFQRQLLKAGMDILVKIEATHFHVNCVKRESLFRRKVPQPSVTSDVYDIRVL